MHSIKKLPLVAMILMAILSFSNLFGVKVAGASVVIGIVVFFIHKAKERQSFAECGCDIRSIGRNLKDKSVWVWMALPLLANVLSLVIAKFILPEYAEQILTRSGAILSYDKAALLVFQLAALSLGEEIAWRAFFQNQLNKALPVLPALILTSVFFGLGHVSEGNILIVLYDVFFVFVNSLFYGMVFQKTKNAWASGISHFAANLLAVVLL